MPEPDDNYRSRGEKEILRGSVREEALRRAAAGMTSPVREAHRRQNTERREARLPQLGRLNGPQAA